MNGGVVALLCLSMITSASVADNSGLHGANHPGVLLFPGDLTYRGQEASPSQVRGQGRTPPQGEIQLKIQLSGLLPGFNYTVFVQELPRQGKFVVQQQEVVFAADDASWRQVFVPLLLLFYLTQKARRFDIIVSEVHPGLSAEDAVVAQRFDYFATVVVDYDHPLLAFDYSRPAAGNASSYFAVAVRQLLDDNLTVKEDLQLWSARHTAILVVDMWAFHPCKTMMRSVQAIVNRMNDTIAAARSRGSLIIHSPSQGVEEMSVMYPAQRLKMRRAAQKCALNSPCFKRTFGKNATLEDADKWFLHRRGSDVEPELPIPVGPADALCPDDDVMPNPEIPFYLHAQHPGVGIGDQDGLSDSTIEIVGALLHHDIRHVVVMGRAANLCLLLRPFALRRLTRIRRSSAAADRWDVVLARDLTDILYDPRQPPYLSHVQAKDLVVRHIERYLCGSVDSSHFRSPPA